MDKNDILRLLLSSSLLQPKVLLVEDCSFDAVFLRRTIDQYYPMTLIDHVPTKAQALAFLSRNTYDVVFLDLGLPDSLGIQDIETIKIASKDTPVIVVTGLYSEGRLLDAQKYGADGMIAKTDLVYNNFEKVMEDALDNINDLPALRA